MKHDTPENRQKATVYLKPLCEIKQPISLGLFAGKVDYSQIGPVWRFIASRDKSEQMAEGDFRDWATIRAWAKDLAAKLSQERPDGTN
jgi:menaquinone-dependent protoporphyrinogen oxidase